MKCIILDLTDAQITKLRELMDALPISGYHDLILPVLKALPRDHESAAVPSNNGADADRQGLHAQGPAGRSFSLTALTPKGEALLPEIRRQLSRLPHIGDEL